MKILLALGANLPSEWGKPAQTLPHAIARLSERIATPAKISHLYATIAQPIGSGPDFVNAVVALEVEMTPRQVLEISHSIELEARRNRDTRWGPRTLDIDLIACDDHVCPNIAEQTHWRTLPLDEQVSTSPDQLILPHPRLQDRAFVLVPMMDVAPEWRHPILGETTEQMLDRLPIEDKRAVKRLHMP